METRAGEQAAIEQALLHAGLPVDIASKRDLSGGCIHRVMQLTLRDGREFVAKINDARQKPLFLEESQSLAALAKTKTVRVPQPLACIEHDGFAVLLMTAILAPASPPNDRAWRRLGSELAAMHQAPAGDRYGFAFDNHIGSTLQPNAWHDNWVTFNAINRLGFQVAVAVDAGLLETRESSRIEVVINRLDQLIPRKPNPSLLHGDLWSGNVVPGNDGLAVIDPACSIGDGLADIAMMKLFGGFPQSCFEAYFEANGKDDSHSPSAEDRIAVYQLYHVLNHINIFGRGYVAQAMSLAGQLGA